MNIFLDIETNGLKSIEHRITCISLNFNSNTYSILGEDESKILEQFWKTINVNDTLITYNGDFFDIPFIIKRSLINNIKIKQIISLDLRRIVNSCKFAYYDKLESGSLNDWSKIMGFGEKINNGLQMIEYYNNSEWDKIKEHCEEDVNLNIELYNRCVKCNLIKEIVSLNNDENSI